MNRIRFVVFAFLMLALVFTGVSAKESTVRYSVDQTLNLAWPGLDGVSAPVLHRTSARAPHAPRIALALNVPSRVTLAIVVRADGTVGRIEPIAVDHPGLGLEETAVAAVQAWRYDPALKNGTKVDAMDLVTVVFPVMNPTLRGAYPGNGMPHTSLDRSASMAIGLPKGVNRLDPNQFATASHRTRTQVTAAVFPHVKLGELYDRTPVGREKLSPTFDPQVSDPPPPTTKSTVGAR